MLRLLIFAVLALLCVHGPMVLFPVYVRSIGGDIDMISRMWILMLVVEIPLIAAAGTGVKRIGPRGLLLVGILAAGLRWSACGVSTSMVLIYAVQLLHGVIVTGILIGGPFYLERVVPERLRSTAQSLFTMSGVGIGGSLSVVISGWLLDHLGPASLYTLGGVGALCLGASLRWLLPDPDKAARLE
jgi:MFS family permease